MTEFPDSVFREYDIRGKAGDQISPDFAYKLAQAYCVWLAASGATENNTIVVGRDVRLSSPELTQAVIRGITDMGLDVEDVGMVATPLAYFTVFQSMAAGCIMITASHNPASDNGFKIMKGRESLHGEDIQVLKQLMQHDYPVATGKGSVRTHQALSLYLDAIVSQAKPIKNVKVVVDAGNGPAGIVAVPLLERLGCEVIPLFCEPDGNFPNHHPDPSKIENLTHLMETVKETGADIGFAFDGDGDRIGVVDHRGKPVWNDMLLLMLSRHLLKSHPGATIISEVKSSGRMYQAIRQAGGNAIMGRTGHSPMKALMKETGALLAGEMSGHIFFADRYYGYDDAIYAAMRILEMLSDENKTLPELISDITPAYSTPEIRVGCPDDLKFHIVDAAKTHFHGLGLKLIEVDGIRIELEHGWGLLRASNTEPSLMMRFEGDSPEHLEEIRGLFEDWLIQRLSHS